jgi:hypothetical protein
LFIIAAFIFRAKLDRELELELERLIAAFIFRAKLDRELELELDRLLGDMLLELDRRNLCLSSAHIVASVSDLSVIPYLLRTTRLSSSLV